MAVALLVEKKMQIFCRQNAREFFARAFPSNGKNFLKQKINRNAMMYFSLDSAKPRRMILHKEDVDRAVQNWDKLLSNISGKARS